MVNFGKTEMKISCLCWLLYEEGIGRVKRTFCVNQALVHDFCISQLIKCKNLKSIANLAARWSVEFTRFYHHIIAYLYNWSSRRWDTGVDPNRKTKSSSCLSIRQQL